MKLLAPVLVVLLTACAAAPTTIPTSVGEDGRGLVAHLASYQVVAGRPERLLIGLMAGEGDFVSFGSVEMTFTYLGTRDRPATSPQPGAPVTADFLPIPASPEDPAAVTPRITFASGGRGVYAAHEVQFDDAGFWQARVTADLGGGDVRSAEAAFEVLRRPAVPDVGDAAIASDLSIIGTPGVLPSTVDSRAASGGEIPDMELHDATLSEALGQKRPILIVFSTPVYCVSRFCGPITDLVQELAGAYRDRAAFIHVEIYADFQNQVVNPAAAEWLSRGGELREPWVFLIDADGRIAEVWDNVATRAGLESALQALPSVSAENRE